jgi:hypothetical protein
MHNDQRCESFVVFTGGRYHLEVEPAINTSLLAEAVSAVVILAGEMPATLSFAGGASARSQRADSSSNNKSSGSNASGSSSTTTAAT